MDFSDLVRGNIANADISISEVCAEFLWLHSLSPREATTKSQVNVTVTAVSTLFSWNYEEFKLSAVSAAFCRIFCRKVDSPNELQ